MPGRGCDLVKEAGLLDLDHDPPPEVVEKALEALSEKLKDAAPLARGIAKVAAVQALNERGVRSPASLVDAALVTPNGRSPGPELQGRSIEFPTIEQWPESVDGASLLDELAATFCAYLSLPSGAPEALALWVMFSHSIEAADFSPRLAILSPEKGCGKTRTLEVLQALVPKPVFTSNISGPNVFRLVEMACPTLLIDEGDSFLGDRNDPIRGILNSGHTRATAWVIRAVGDDYEPRRFGTWCPMAIARIGSLWDTLEARSIVLWLHRRRPNERIKRLRRKDVEGCLRDLRSKVARWATDNLDALRDADPVMPECLGDRQQDNWRFQVAIADLAGGPWPDTARRVAKALSGEDNLTDESTGVQLLTDIRQILPEGSEKVVGSVDLMDGLNNLPDRPWRDFSRGNGINQCRLAALLRPFGIRPKGIRMGEATRRGYIVEQLREVFERYLPAKTPVDAETPQQPAPVEEFGAIRECNMGEPVADQSLTKALAPPEVLQCGGPERANLARSRPSDRRRNERHGTSHNAPAVDHSDGCLAVESDDSLRWRDL